MQPPCIFLDKKMKKSIEEEKNFFKTKKIINGSFEIKK